MTPNLYRLSALVAAMAGATALPLAAQTTQPAQPVQVQAEAARPAAEGMTVVRDAETGKLRAPTAAEAEALRAAPAASRSDRSVNAAVTAPQIRVHRSGARGVRMTDESLHHTTIVRHADGSTSLQCFDSKGGMHAAHSDLAPSPKAAAKLETE